MSVLPKRWMFVAAVGYGVLFSLALTGAVRIGYSMAGETLSEQAAGNLFLYSSLITGALSAYLYSRFVKSNEDAEGLGASELPTPPRN